MKRHSIQELNDLFLTGESADREVFAEQRSNIQLIAGEHYARKGNKFWNRLRDNKDLTYDQKIRLTKNHIRKIVLTYRNSITSYAPGVQAGAKDKTSLQHQKTAELVNAVWQDGKERHDFNKKINEAASDFIGIGEVWAKLFFDPSAGKFLGMQAQVDENGQVAVDENGQPIPSDIAKFAGDVLWERIYGFNIIRPAGCKNLKDAPWLCHRKMVVTKEVHQLIDASNKLDDEEKTKLKAKVVDSMDQTYIVLDYNTGKYRNIKDQTMLKEYFFKPCPLYPKGYFYITVNESVLFDGELPFGIYPLIFGGFDEIQTSPRYRSVVKQLRPSQIEVNRCASKMAEHQITLGDDKVLIQNGSKLTPGMALPGVRSFNYSGMTPIVMQGRSGEQYVEPMNNAISEMYQIAMVDEQKEEKGVFDAYAMLFRSLKDKKKFSLYTDEFESFLKQVFKTYVQLCQKYYGENHLVPAIGKSEYINISEFKNVDDLCYSIVLAAQSDDSESKLGKQMMLDKIIQYVGPQLAKDDIGKIIRMMPYANDEIILEDLTMDYDFAVNYMLQLDRGQMPTAAPPNPAYLIKKLNMRQTKADFSLLAPQIQQMYAQALSQVEDIKVQQEMQIKMSESEFIPTGGYLVACDFYVPDPTNPQKLPKRVRLPSESLDWLIKHLDTQGSDQKTLEGMGQGALAQMSGKFMDQLHQQQGAGTQSQGSAPQMMPQTGQTNPTGVVHGY